ncbi:hypothetical protein DJ568_01745 [Mucilaginibacter hurinus]|uniref:Glycine zipper domain-containing protein n=1 Tax=Mucilaginibacter hurinus TaxID=2201324 RepID=A0A367GTV7_9SPHI|nr:glycine zipper domain-containing protein [Mucilaginibacter hurinus]RCH56608.1 hypothetical protein DJ568_01745 [Mucilaginibacter hurinus]
MKKFAICTSLAMALLLSAGETASAQQTPKKDISPQGKGAIIGGAGGAVVGGIVGGNVKGALIGGALGAGTGYVIGNEKRMNKEKKAATYKKSTVKKNQ